MLKLINEITVDTRGLNHVDSMNLIKRALSAWEQNNHRIQVFVEQNDKKEFVGHVLELLTTCEPFIEDSGDYSIVKLSIADNHNSIVNSKRRNP